MAEMADNLAVPIKAQQEVTLAALLLLEILHLQVVVTVVDSLLTAPVEVDLEL
jgi:hypothetical protein